MTFVVVTQIVDAEQHQRLLVDELTKPAMRGFGSLIERALGHNLSGKATIEFLLEGVRALVRAPLPTKAGEPVAAGGGMRFMPPALAGKRVLVGEDEMLVALLVEDILAEAGCIVIGPFARVRNALEAIQTEVADLALLDGAGAGRQPTLHRCPGGSCSGDADRDRVGDPDHFVQRRSREGHLTALGRH